MSKQKLVILGGGESGVGAALLAKEKGYEVFLSDGGLIQPKYEQELQDHLIEYEAGKHTDLRILEASEIIKSPGIPNDAPIIKEAMAHNIPIISEIEFAARYTQAKIIAITGSNGKTTTTLLTYHLLKSAGFNVGVAGNVGNSFAREILQHQYDYWVLEVSSFQLDNCYEFKPDVAVILNITPDHMDRYNYNFQNYVDAKFRILQKGDANQAFVYFKDNPAIALELKQKTLSQRHFPISLNEAVESGAYCLGKDLHFRLKHNGLTFNLAPEEITLKGKHNQVNVMAAVLACLEAGANPESLREYFKTFKGIEHRLEEVATINGIRFINDSKATNVDSVFYALDSFDDNIVWIAGGIDKGNDYDKIRELVKQKVKYLVCLGIDNDKLFNYFRNDVKIVVQTDNIKDAVEQAYEFARKGDIVLLSPACASFDLFQNYEDRGNQFKKAVSKLSKLDGVKRD
jgi:UDP-N-acetylmuramoylalanine--D-glutamate ligase